MNIPRESHIMVALNSKYIYAIGSRILKYSQKVEVFDIELNMWKEQAPLNQGRYYASACSFSKRFLYVFGGISKQGVVQSIEKFDCFKQENQKWQVLQLQMGQPEKGVEAQEWDGRYFCGSAQISESKILIFGGFSQHAITNSCFELDVLAEEITASSFGCLDRNDSFYQR